MGSEGLASPAVKDHWEKLDLVTGMYAWSLPMALGSEDWPTTCRTPVCPKDSRGGPWELQIGESEVEQNLSGHSRLKD